MNIIKHNKSNGIVKAFTYLALISLSLQSQAISLNDFTLETLSSDETRLIFTFDAPPPQALDYKIESPARITFDLEGVSSNLKAKHHDIGIGNATSLAVLEAENKTRIVINLIRLQSYRTVTENNTFIIILSESSSNQQVIDAFSDGNNKNITLSKQTLAVVNIDFERGLEGEGNVVIKLSDPSVAIDLHPEGGKLMVELLGVSLPDHLKRRLDVVDFATPVKFIDATMELGNALIAIEPEGDYEHMAYQADDLFTVSVKPISAEVLEQKKKKAFAFTGEKLSLNFQDIPVRSVLQLIADFTGLNLVASDTVSGRITLRLQNIPWDQALELILKTKGLDKRKVGNVLLVAPADEIAAREKLEIEANRQVEELAPIQSEFIVVKYAKAEDIQGFLSGEQGMVSERGSVLVDARTNTLLIRDTKQKLEEIRNVVLTLDVPVKQVLIEARIVIANADFTNEIGVSWGSVGWDATNSGNLYTVGGSQTSNMAATEDLTDPDSSGVSISRPDNLIVDLGVTSANATKFALGRWSGTQGWWELELSALESEGKGEVIATPKVLTADQQQAEIVSGQEVPYWEASSSGASSLKFKEAVLGLTVTPHITPNDRIIMDLDVRQDSVGSLVGTQQIPTIDTNRITSKVLVENGETIVLGGVFRMKQLESLVKTPFFGDLPIIGRFFRKKGKIEEKQELLIFITPKIVEDFLDG